MTAIISKNGKLLFNIQASDEIVRLNTPEDCLAVDDPPHSNMFYENGWVAMPIQPSPYHVFDYTTKQWIDPRSLDEIKAQKWAEIKKQRDALEFGGFEFEGNIYDSDQVSQARIHSAVALNVPTVWITKSNKEVELSPSDMVALQQALAQHISRIHVEFQELRKQIYATKSFDELNTLLSSIQEH